VGGDLADSITLEQLGHRPNITPEVLYDLMPTADRFRIDIKALRAALADSVYSGYLESQTSTLARLYKHDGLIIPEGFSFRQIQSLSREMVERLERTQPRNFGHARRVPGLTPAALSTLLVQLTKTQSHSSIRSRAI